MESLTMISWNIRGINNSTARRNLQTLLRIHNPIFLFLQESKCASLTESIKDFLWSLQEHSWIFSPAIGQSGGLIISWNRMHFSLSSSQVNKSWIWIRGKLSNSSDYINCINIYSPNELHDKKELWRDMSSILSSNEGEPFGIMGDFNSIVSEEERINCSYRRNDSESFKSFITGNGLWDVPLVKFKYTWFGSQGKSSRLDRVLLNNSWLQQEGNWRLQGLGRKSSDHMALLLNSKAQNWVRDHSKSSTTGGKTTDFLTEL